MGYYPFTPRHVWIGTWPCEQMHVISATADVLCGR